MNLIYRKLDSIFSELSKSQHASRQQMATICRSVEDLCLYSKKLGRTLLEVTEIYTRAERSAFNGGNNHTEQAAKQSVAPVLSTAREKQGVLLFGNLLLPDWLQAAVFKYEQSKYTPMQ